MTHNNILSKKFTVAQLLRFALPTVVMMVFMSLYTMVDGVFVSRMVGTTALSAVNIVYPLLNVVIAAGVMLATGASAVIAAQMGEGKQREAKQNFTFIVLVGIGFGLFTSLVGFLFLNPMLRFLGANDAVWQYCVDYTLTLLPFVAPAMLQMLFQSFFVVAGRPSLGLGIIAAGGVANIVLDYVFIGPLGMGITGAALATGIGFSIPALFGLWFFWANKQGSLHFVKPKWNGKMLLKSCANGSSEMVTNLSMAVITLLFNLIMMHRLGEDGVAAITIILYAEYLLTSIYLGYSTGVAPVVSYKYGNRDDEGLRHTFKTSMRFIGISSLAMFLASILLAEPIVGIFATPGTPVWQIATNGFYLYGFAFLFKGVNIFASSLFTALNNGVVSAVLSFLRTFVFLVALLAVLPGLWGVDGVWLSVPLAEVLSLLLSMGFIFAKRKAYRYA